MQLVRTALQGPVYALAGIARRMVCVWASLMDCWLSLWTVSSGYWLLGVPQAAGARGILIAGTTEVHAGPGMGEW